MAMILGGMILVYLYTFAGIHLTLCVYNKYLEIKERKKRIDKEEKRRYTEEKK